MNFILAWHSFLSHRTARVVAVLVLAGLVFWAGIYWAKQPVYPELFVDGKGGAIARDMAVSYAPSMISPIPPMSEGDLGQYKTVGSKIIKTGSLNLDVKSTNEAMASINAVAIKYEGFVESSNTWLDEYKNALYGTVTLRVAFTYFDVAMNELKVLATVVRSESISGQDVTEQFIDLEARLKNLKAEESQYLEILKKATKVEDLLNVHNALAQVRSEIESLEGQIQALTNRTDYSSITVSIQEEPSIVAPTRTWKPVVVVKEALQNLVEASQGFVNGFIYLVVFGLPFAVVLGLGYWVWRRVRR